LPAEVLQMTAQKEVRISEAPDEVIDPGESANEVRLRGRLAATPRLRELPSGDTVWNLRVVVERPPLPAGQDRPRQRVDSLECAVWSGRLKSQVAKWDAGDIVEVSGALRRRFFRAGGATASRVEVELSSGRRLRRAGSG
jgi:single-strand DNA-binding protein